ncbi:hypothetical protein TWF730_006606 [Orbilia blumenaviensis]|uniref:NAD(P)H-hydrate epimerase n=1 Tax=Orbilia blumenaviensis TaxID=1796055 RepID=A0AAV9VHD1_9PEZI
MQRTAAIRLSGILNTVSKRPLVSNIPTTATLFHKKRMSSFSVKTLGAQEAIELDKELMGPEGGYSLDQLMELAGLSVANTVYKVHPLSNGERILVLCGPGNNGGDGLVAARHLWHYGYKPTIYFPKKGKNEIFERLSTQLRGLGVPFTEDYEAALKETDHIVDAIFGFSFTGTTIRAPFDAVITAMKSSKAPTTSVDVPSSWDVENGPPSEGPGKDFQPENLISLTAPKHLTRHFKGRHFLGGRFCPPYLQEKYGLDLKGLYQGVDQIAELPAAE